MTEFEGQVLADLSVLKSQMSQLMGIGQPGRIIQLEKRVERMRKGATDEGDGGCCGRSLDDRSPGD